MRTLQFWGFLFAALACMAVGVEAERIHMLATTPDASPAGASAAAGTGEAAPPVGAGPDVDWGAWARMLPLPFALPDAWAPLSTRELWQASFPSSSGWVESLGREQVHDGVWRSIFLPVLAAPPALWLGVLALLAFAFARLGRGQQVPTPGGVRTGVRLAALGLAAAGFAVLGADLFRSSGAWETRTVFDVWALAHPASLEVVGTGGWIGGVMTWPAWLGLALVGGVVAYLTRPRPDLVMYAYPPNAGSAPVRFIDLSRTMAYLDSMRSWPPRRRKRGGDVPERDLVDPRHFD